MYYLGIMLERIKAVTATPIFLLKVFKKTKIDNFAGGLIVGAIFSLAVNIVTVKIQEDLSKQRTLEALDREITYHLLDVSGIVKASTDLQKTVSKDQLNADLIMNRRFSTRVWDNTESMRYLLELDPQVAAEVELYYEIFVKNMNRMLDDDSKIYNELYQSCRPFYSFTTNKVPQRKEICDNIARQSASLQATVAGKIVNDLDRVKKIFHPTRDRLNSFWLKLLLGNKSVEILK